MKCIIFVIVFLSFFAVSCSGEEPTLPDNESKTDESIDENPDEDVVESTDEADDTVSTDEDTTEPVCTDGDRMCSTVDNGQWILVCVDGFWQGERKCRENSGQDPEVFYCREAWDSNLYCTDYEVPADPSFVKLQNLEECKDSPCSQLCLLMWDEETKERIFWFNLAKNGEEIDSKDSYLDIWLETSHNICYANFVDHTEIAWDYSQIESEKIPVQGTKEDLNNPYYGTLIYFFFSDTGETWQGKKKYNYGDYTSCINNDGINWCEEEGDEPVYVEGIEGPCYRWSDIDFVPLPK
ncbi:MAG: hypothetical protein WC414_02015 [Patescibacteria group bacterium]